MTEGSSDPIRTRVGELINTHGSVRAAAKAIGIESSYLFRLSTGEKSSPSDATLAKLGMKRVITFERIQQRLTQLGFQFNQPVVIYCQSHHRSALAYLIGRLLGWQVLAYDGAWSEWGNHPNSPIVSGEHPF